MIRETIIRPARKDDAGDIGRIHVASWRAVYQEILPPSFLVQMQAEQIARTVRPYLTAPWNVYLVAESEQGVVGYAAAGPARDRDPVYQAEIHELYLLPEVQRQGLGRELLAQAARMLYQSGYVALQTWALTRNPNRRFYEKCGGLFLRNKPIVFAGRTLQAAGYGWIDITLAMDSPAS
jgi:GNAT superfamily N-acetyltransferase